MTAHKNTPALEAPQPGVRSMTGFGRAEDAGSPSRICAEIRSVNGRFLKLGIKLPSRYGALEERVKAVLAEHGVRRGSVEVGVYIENGTAADGAMSINAATLHAYVKQARAAGKKAGVKGGPSLDALLALPGVLARADVKEDLEDIWRRCLPVLRKGLAAFDAMRLKEGTALAKDIRARLAELMAHHAVLASAAPVALKANVAHFQKRIEKLLQDAGVSKPLDRDLLEREIVLASDRMDISEELTRLASHVEQMTATLALGTETGKQLDFLTQELNREVNTIGSKANDQAITHRVVEMKMLVEKIREQVQNLE